MINSGVPDTIIDFWLGHSIGEMSEAYKSVQFDSLKKMYQEREKLLSVSGSKVDVEEIEERIRKDSRELREMVLKLTRENLDMKESFNKIEAEVKTLKGLFVESLNEKNT